jgi:hypothetical protein
VRGEKEIKEGRKIGTRLDDPHKSVRQASTLDEPLIEHTQEWVVQHQDSQSV